MDLAERTLQLCRIRSPVGEEAEIAAYVAAETGGERIGNAVRYRKATSPLAARTAACTAAGPAT